MAILYTIGNVNLNTIEVVANSIKEAEPELEIKKIVIFDSYESEQKQNDQIEIYRKYFGNVIRESILLNEDGTIDTQKLFEAFDNKEIKIVDLTNGRKASTSILYMAANLCQIDRIYYCIVKTEPKPNMILGKDYEFIKMKNLNYVGKLAKISSFDLIYYMDEISALFNESERVNPGPLKNIYDHLVTGIKEYFSEENYQSVVYNMTVGNRKIIDSLRQFILTDRNCIDFCRRNNVDILSARDLVGGISYFLRKCAQDHSVNEDLLKLVPLSGMISSGRELRNISAHNSENLYEFTEGQARYAITLSIESLKIVHQNSTLWNILSERT